MLGARSAALADEKKKLEPLVKARLKARNEAAAENLKALGAEDPVGKELPDPSAAAVELAARDADDGEDFE